MKDFKEASNILDKTKTALSNNWSIKINDIIKKEPTFYSLYNVDVDRIKEIITSIESNDFECKIKNITSNNDIYVFGKELALKNQNNDLEKLPVHIRLSLLEDQKEILFSISKAKYKD